MSSLSPQSSAGRGTASSPYAGTDPTLYSPELARDTKHRHGNASVSTVVGGSGKKVKVTAANFGIGISINNDPVLPKPSAYVPGGFVNELVEHDAKFVSRFQLITALPDGTEAGVDQEHEMFSVQHQMKLVSVQLFLIS